VSINQEIADSLREIATLLEEQDAGPFRVNAYRRAASTVVNLDEPISQIVEQKGLPGLIALAGIGEGIARSIYEYVAMGCMSRLESLRGGHDPVALFKQIPGVGSTLAVHGELIIKPLREADRFLCSESANGSLSTLFAVWECLQLLQPAYHRRVSYGHNDGCNRPGSLQAFSPSQRYSRIKYGQETHGEWFR
jgi:hypothetical protein